MKKFPVLVMPAILMVGIFLLAAQAPIEPRVGSLETRVAQLETQVGYIVPTQEVFAPTPTIPPTPSATPQWCYGRGKVNTPNSQLRVRETPNGAVVRTLADGALVVFSTQTQQVGPYTWVEITTGGYVALEFIIQEGLLTCR